MNGATSSIGAVTPDADGPDRTILRQALAAGPLCAGRLVGAGGAIPSGVALRLLDYDLFQLVLLDADHRDLLVLGPFEETDVVAVWRSIGASSGLPLLLARADGVVQAPYPQIGRLQLGPIRIRRRHGLPRGRRPRFLVRRKTGALPVCPHVHGGRELAGGGRD